MILWMRLQYNKYKLFPSILDTHKNFQIEDSLKLITEKNVVVIGVAFTSKITNRSTSIKSGELLTKILLTLSPKLVTYYVYEIQDLNSSISRTFCLFFLSNRTYAIFDAVLKMHFG